MNKAIIASLLLAVVGCVAANKLHRGRHNEHDNFEHESHHLEHPHHGSFDDGFDGDFDHRHVGFGHGHGHGLGHGLSHGGLGHEGHHLGEHELHHLGHEGIRHSGLRKQVHRGKHSKLGKRTGGLRRPIGAGIGGVGAAGAIGGIREHEGHAAGIESGTRLTDRKSIQGKKGFIAGDKKGVEADFHNHSDNENAGIHKHQVLNKNKVFIKDQTTGVNDVDAFRHSNDRSDSAHIGAGDSKFIGAGSSGKIASEKEFDHDLRAGVAGDESLEAGGAIGGIGAGGAGEIF